MVDFVARAAAWSWIVVAGRRGPKGDSGRATDPFGPWRSSAARRGQAAVGVAESAILATTLEAMRRAPPTASTRTAVLLLLASVVVMVVLVAAIAPLRDAFSATLHGDTARLRSDLRGWGVVGVLVLIALCLIHAVVIFPTEVANAAAGYVYGFWLGLGIVMVGWTASSIVAYAIGRHLGRPALRRLAGRERVERVERVVERGGATGLLAVRLIPLLPYSGIGYVAGACLWTALGETTSSGQSAVNSEASRSAPDW